jgi:G3E family GTPase
MQNLGPPRLVVVVPGYADIAGVGRAIALHPKLASALEIVSGVCCINVRNLFDDASIVASNSNDSIGFPDFPRSLLTNLAEQISAGWTETVCLTNCDGARPRDIEAASRIVRERNPAADVLRCSGGFGRPLRLASSNADRQACFHFYLFLSVIYLADNTSFKKK